MLINEDDMSRITKRSQGAAQVRRLIGMGFVRDVDFRVDGNRPVMTWEQFNGTAKRRSDRGLRLDRIDG